MKGVQFKKGGKLLLVERMFVDEDDSKVYRLQNSDSGRIFTNRGVLGVCRIFLPDKPDVGIEFTFAVVEAYELKIDPVTTKIRAGNTAQDEKYYSANAIGDSMRICASQNGDWVVISKSGTWTRET